ncbi:pentapeptide repeat-containing protein [Aquicoccus sp.]|uniref:pentapeptide repeat-containing protein n=1 Tax=Aquicoccus sp. TaxID=2055851 RepID=UPI00356945CB
MDQTTVTLPISEQALWVILSAIGLAALTGLLWLTLNEQDRKTERDPLSLLTAFGWVLLPVWLVIFVATLWQVWLVVIGGTGTLSDSTSLGTGALIAALLGAPFVIWGTVLKHQTVRYQKEGHITDRITSAVEQLGAEKTVKKDGDETTKPNIEVRIGAILSLERIAQDSTTHDNGRDHVRVMEILCAYVRENAPASKAPDLPFPQECKQDTIDEKRKSTPSWITNEFTLRTDVQLALSVIGRRTRQQVKVERNHPTQDGTGYRLDLSRTNLRYADFQYLDFERTNFFRSQMQAIFCKSANFSGANFVYCELTGANAANANFSNARIESADLSHATLREADLLDCKISHTHFVRANLQGSRIRFCNNVDNREVNRAFFVDCDLRCALIQGDLLGVVIKLEPLPDETIPRGIIAAAFRSARVGATRQFLDRLLNETAIPNDWLHKAFGDASVTLPQGIDRPAHWPDWELPHTGEHAFHTEWRKWQANPSNYTPPPKPTD